MSKGNFKLSPSDFAFLWEECKRCFYLKVARGFPRPFGPFPKIFNLIDNEMKNYYLNMRTEKIDPEIPAGVVKYSEQWVESKPILSTQFGASCYIKGKFDTVLQFDDDTYGVIDFKTSRTSSGHVSLYGRQLHAYAHCLENPAGSAFSVSPISRLGLLVYEPDKYGFVSKDRVALEGAIAWINIPLDKKGFLAFIDKVLSVLTRTEPPPAHPECGWCRYREKSRKSGL